MLPLLKPASVDKTLGHIYHQPATVAYQQMALAAGLQLQQPAAAYVPITSQYIRCSLHVEPARFLAR